MDVVALSRKGGEDSTSPEGIAVYVTSGRTCWRSAADAHESSLVNPASPRLGGLREQRWRCGHETAAPADTRLKELLDAVLAYPDVPARWSGRELEITPLPVMTTSFHHNGIELRFFSTLTTFAAARDVTLDEIRIECMFPADDATTAFCRSLA
jgi:hypothetical protein